MIFVSRDENNTLYAGIEEIEYYGYKFNKNIAKSSYPIRIVNNKFGKVIVLVSGYSRTLQILLANIESLISKDKEIDYNYISKVFVNKFKDILKAQYLDYEENDTGSAKTFLDIVIIFNKKMFIIHDDAIIECENQYYANTDFYTNLEEMLYKSESVHDESFILKMFDRVNKVCNYHKERILLINDKDYSIKVRKL